MKTDKTFYNTLEEHCLPEICIGNVILDEFMERVVDDFLEVHRVLLLEEGETKKNQCWGR